MVVLLNELTAAQRPDVDVPLLVAAALQGARRGGTVAGEAREGAGGADLEAARLLQLPVRDARRTPQHCEYKCANVIRRLHLCAYSVTWRCI